MESTPQDTRAPLTVWFEAAWLMAVTRNGVSAASLQPCQRLGSYETAWAMCHKLRTAMGRPSVDLLSGNVEVDETFIGGVKTGGKRGRSAPGKACVVSGVESKGTTFGRCRLEVVPKIDAAHLGQLLHRHITPGSVVITDSLPPGPHALPDSYGHRAVQHQAFRPARPRGAARGASGGEPAAALARHHPPVRRLRRAPAGQPRRVHLPVQPPALPCPRAAVPPPPQRFRERPTDDHARVDQGPQPKSGADASTDQTSVAVKPCRTATRPSLARPRLPQTTAMIPIAH